MLGSPWTGYILIPQSLFPTTTRTWCSTRGAWSWDQNWQSTRPICWLPIPCPKWASFPKFVSRTDVLPRRSERKPTSKEANRIPFSTKRPLPIYHVSIKPGSFKWESRGEIGYTGKPVLGLKPSEFKSHCGITGLAIFIASVTLSDFDLCLTKHQNGESVCSD